MKLSDLQLLWLEAHGGRTAHDVFEKDGKRFVHMGNEYSKYTELPKDKDIHFERCLDVRSWRIRRTDYYVKR
jgi:hypothetical protein